ncbi:MULTISPECIES: hypothetical protein [unclassified Actinotalea]|uniref:hypothetical protein n=1 Tax=unclassified Actinotalea TaxID=2638618 RepID=UPI0015F75459|nr:MULTISPECIES: hypothetical protein [unclassified Actinotalea]
MSNRTTGTRPLPHPHRERTPLPERTARRGVAVYVEVPSGEGFPDSGELLDLAGTLYELAQDLVPGATTRTEVRLTDDAPPEPPT